jgi:hypothetical protein
MLHDFDESQNSGACSPSRREVLMGGRIGETIEFYYLDASRI